SLSLYIILYFHFIFFFLFIRPTPNSTLFPYTTLFRSKFQLSVQHYDLCLIVTNNNLSPVHNQFGTLLILISLIHIQLQLSQLNRSEEHTSELQSRFDLVCRLLLEKKKKKNSNNE